MKQENGQRQYMAFLVRLWHIDDHRPLVWRASVQDPHTGVRRSFADLESLFAFLREQTDGTRANPDKS
jgi:hypothetical protein